MNKEHKGQKVESPLTEEQGSPLPESSPTPEPPSVQSSRPIADHRSNEDLRNVALETRSHFTSKYERMMAEEKRRLGDRKSTRLNSSHRSLSRMPSSA